MLLRIKLLPFQRAVAIVLFACMPLFCGHASQADGAATQKTSPASASALTNEAESILDNWRGQTIFLDQAAEKLFFALKQNPKYAKAFVQVGRLHSMDGHYNSEYFEPSSLAASERAIKKAIELDAKLAEAFVLLGHLYTVMNRIPEAKDALAKAGEIKTDSPWLAMNWAAIFEKERKYEEAAQLYAQVIASKTKKLKALGSAYQGLQDFYISIGSV